MSSLITDIGNQKLLVASPQTPVTIKSVAIGSGRGAFTSAIQKIQDQKWIGNASAPIKNGKTLEFDCQIPLGVGGFEVAEWGLIDIEGDLIAYGQILETVNKITSMTLTPTFVMELGDSISAEIIVTDEINFRHNGMTERDATDAHPTKSITGLDEALKTLTDTDTAIQAEIDLNKKITVINTDYTLTDSDAGSFLIDASAGDIVVTMAKASTSKALKHVFVRTDTTASTVTIKPATGDKFCGEGFEWPLTYIRKLEPFIFQKINSSMWSGIRGNRAVLVESDGVPRFVNSGVDSGRFLLESNIVNNLSSTSTINPLSAAQGKALNDAKLNISSIVNNLTSTSTNAPLSANMGKALNDQSFGVGQSVQNVTAGRVSGTTYTNTTGKPITVYVTTGQNSGGTNIAFYINSILVFDILNDADGDQKSWCTVIVPPGNTYRADLTGGLGLWVEIR